MGTKQVQMKFQVAAIDQVSAQVTITAGGTQVFSGPLADTTDAIVSGDIKEDTVPFSEVSFDLDVVDQPIPPTSPPNNWSEWTVPVDITISVSGGDIGLQNTEANYTAKMGQVDPPTDPATYITYPGDAARFFQLQYATQPVWTPPATGRLDIADNVNTGPGSLVLLDGESVTYQVAMTTYSA
jgi:hypothetical protein